MTIRKCRHAPCISSIAMLSIALRANKQAGVSLTDYLHTYTECQPTFEFLSRHECIAISIATYEHWQGMQKMPGGNFSKGRPVHQMRNPLILWSWWTRKEVGCLYVAIIILGQAKLIPCFPSTKFCTCMWAPRAVIFHYSLYSNLP